MYIALHNYKAVRNQESARLVKKLVKLNCKLFIGYFQTLDVKTKALVPWFFNITPHNHIAPKIILTKKFCITKF